MSTLTGLTKVLTAMLLSGMLIMGSASGSVYASERNVDSKQISEVAVEDAFSKEEYIDMSESEIPVNLVEISEESSSEEMNNPLEEADDYYTVTLDANGGYFVNEWDDSLSDYVEQAEVIHKLIPIGEQIATFPIFTEKNFDGQQIQAMSFRGWSLESNGELITVGDEAFVPVDNCVLYAAWQVNETIANGAEDAQNNFEDTGDSDTTAIENMDDAAHGDEYNEENTTEEPLPEEAEYYATTLDANNEQVSENEVVSLDYEYDDVSEIIDSGTCGQNINWTLQSDGLLSISGVGKMSTYASTAYPWKNYSNIITVISMDEGITSISDYSFSDLINVVNVNLPKSLENIGRSSFSGCVSLYNVTIKGNIGDYAFYKCGNLHEVVIGDGIQKIGNRAFAECSSLYSINLPNTLSELGASAFYKCRSLSSISIPGSVKTIGNYSFYLCRSMNTVSFGNGIIAIGEHAFESCNSIKNLIIPGSMTSIGKSSFWGCSGLESLTIENGCSCIEEYAFYECSELKNVFLPDSIMTIGKAAFYNCYSIEMINLPSSMARIEDSTFAYCFGLKYIYIPDNIKSIGAYAFTGCGFKTFTIPNNVVTIEKRVFSECYSLESVFIHDNVLSIESDSFLGCNLLTLYGSDDSYSKMYASEYSISFVDPWKLQYAEVSIMEDSIVYTGELVKPQITVTLAGKLLVSDTDFRVSYKNNANAGTATITITGIGDYTGTVSRTFIIARAAQSLSAKISADSVAVGKTIIMTASGAKETSEYSYTSSNTKVATVSTKGVVTGKSAGTVTITVKTPQTKNYNAASKTVKITVIADKVLKKPGNCHFAKWNNSKYTNCQIAWNKVDGADGYQTLLSWTDGSHASSTYTKSNVLYRNCTVHPQHVSQMKVRGYYTQNGRRKFGPWSNVEYITPSPTTLTTKNASVGSNLKMNVSWNIIYGCNGYNVFITTNPNGKWYWYQSTVQNATSRSSVITKCGGAKLKKNTWYYVRIVTRRKRNGVFCTVPMPSNNAYTGTFIIK